MTVHDLFPERGLVPQAEEAALSASLSGFAGVSRAHLAAAIDWIR